MTTVETRPTLDAQPNISETPKIIARVAVNQPPEPVIIPPSEKHEIIVDTKGQALGIIIGGHALLNAGFSDSNQQPRLTGLPSTSVIGGFRSKAK